MTLEVFIYLPSIQPKINMKKIITLIITILASSYLLAQGGAFTLDPNMNQFSQNLQMFEIQQANFSQEDSILVEPTQKKVRSFDASKEKPRKRKASRSGKRSRKVRK